MGNKSYIKKALFLVPSPSSKGGISNYYSVIKSSIPFPYEYFYRGVRKQHSYISRLFSVFVIIRDYVVFVTKIKSRKYSLVLVNTSFGKSGFWRDYIFIKILQYYQCKFIVFFRGIDDHILENYIYSKNLDSFRNSFLKADAIIVLSQNLKHRLISMGFDGRIRTETTVVDSSLVSGINIGTIKEKQCESHIKLLFLSRIERDKGIFELIESFKLIHKRYPNTSLHICGIGSEERAIKGIIETEKSIFFKGYVENSNKKEEYLTSHIFILPTSHEGIPNSVIEAMAFGLPVITSPVGGIPDIFSDGINGILLPNKKVEVIFDSIEKLILDKTLRIKCGINNYLVSKETFYKEKVVFRLSEIINSII